MQGGKVEQTSSRGFRLETFEHEEPAEAEKTGDGSSSDRATVDRVAGDDPRSGGGVGQANHEETEGMAYEVLPGAAAEGQHTENAAEALATRDRNMQRKVQKLDMRAADLAWAWVAHKKQQGQTIGEVCRPESGPFRTTQVLWELQAQAITGWNTEVRQLITRKVLQKVVLSRKVLESVHRFTAKGRAMRNDVPDGERPDMEMEAVVMTPHLAHLVWGNVKKLGGLTGNHGVGKRRFWACIRMLMWEGVIEGDVGKHYRDMEWEGMAEDLEMLR